MTNYLLFIILLLICCFLSALSQVLLKKSALETYSNMIQQYLNVKVIVAYSIFFCVVLLNTYIIRFLPMNVVSAVSESVPPVLSCIFGFLFFGEKITARKILGCGSIILGVVIIAL